MNKLSEETVYYLKFTDFEIDVLRKALRYQIECTDDNQPLENDVELANNLSAFLNEV